MPTGRASPARRSRTSPRCARSSSHGCARVWPGHWTPPRTAALNAGTYTGVSNADMLTGIRLGLATVQAQGYGTPASVVLNPADLAAIDISIMGSTMSGPQLNNSVWGLNFIPASGVAVGTAYVGDLGSAVQLFRRANAADLPHRQPR